MLEVLTAISDFVKACDKGRLQYVIGGSVCSGIHSLLRNTNDVDVVVGRSLIATDAAILALKEKFIVDEIALQKSHERGRCFNVFHEETAIKFDLFPAIVSFHFKQLERAVVVHPPSSPLPFRIASLEDIIVAKLNWLRQSGSERQRNDLLSLIAVNKTNIDLDYVAEWAAVLGALEVFQELFNKKNT